MQLRHRISWRLGLIVAVLMGGCALRRGMEVSIPEPADGWSPRTAVDIRNYHGSVTVIVDPTVRTAVPSVTVGAAPPVTEIMDSKASESVSVVMDLIEQEGGRVLTVRTGTTWYNPEEVWVDLTLRVPSCSGATIWNRGGMVELVGVSGAVQVDNGVVGSSGGPIQLRTAQAMTAPVTLTTQRGSVVYQVGPNSSGLFELTAPDGRAEFSNRANATESLSSDGVTTVARLNGGTNKVSLRSDKGLVRVMVMENAEAYTDRTR